MGEIKQTHNLSGIKLCGHDRKDHFMLMCSFRFSVDCESSSPSQAETLDTDIFIRYSLDCSGLFQESSLTLITGYATLGSQAFAIIGEESFTFLFRNFAPLFFA